MHTQRIEPRHTGKTTHKSNTLPPIPRGQTNLWENNLLKNKEGEKTAFHNIRSRYQILPKKRHAVTPDLYYVQQRAIAYFEALVETNRLKLEWSKSVNKPMTYGALKIRNFSDRKFSFDHNSRTQQLQMLYFISFKSEDLTLTLLQIS